MKKSVLNRIAAGDLTAVNDCIAQYGRVVRTLARRLSRTQADAEDATQEIFLNIWRGAVVFDAAKGCETTFIMMVARRRLIDRQRKWKSELMIDQSIDVGEASASDTGAYLQVSVEAEAAMEAFQQLRPEQRRLLELSLILGLSHSEISTRLCIPLGTVKSQIRRGLTRLRRYMRINADFGSDSVGAHA